MKEKEDSNDKQISSDQIDSNQKKKLNEKNTIYSHKIFIVLLLFLTNLLNFVDRYSLAGILKDLQDYFLINDSFTGLLQTAFICFYMLSAPTFGFLGDRYSRKWIIIFGVSLWSSMTLLGSFVPPDKFWAFLITRCFLGVGQASYSCVAPTLIGDLFVSKSRTKVLAIFYLAALLGGGLGYILSSSISNAFEDWRWSLRFTPILSCFCVVLLIFFVREPKREGGTIYEDKKASLTTDIVYLFKNKTFIFITFGYTFGQFVLGGISWWVPLYVEYAIYSKNKIPEQIPLYFGIVTCLAGFIGVLLSSLTAPKLRSIKPNSDALVCAFGSLVAVPTLFVLILTTRTIHPILFWCLSCVVITVLCLSWTLVSDILLYVIYPNKRSTALAFKILISHLFGDAGSPYIIGAISDFFRKGKPDTYFVRFSSLQIALYLGSFFALFSFASYLFGAIYLECDKKKVDLIIKKNHKLATESEENRNQDGANEQETSLIEKNHSTNQSIEKIIDDQKKIGTQ